MNTLRNWVAWLVALSAWVIWRSAMVPCDDDEFRNLAREWEGQ